MFDQIDRILKRLYKDHMKTLTITEAKKNLSRWLAAAAQGQDVGIVCGADIIALRKIEVESTDYAQREYATTREQIEALDESDGQKIPQAQAVGKTNYSERGAIKEDA